MKHLFRYILNHFYKPLLAKYLSVTRSYTYSNIHLQIPPQVFHPGFFFSTQLLLRYCQTLSLQQKTFLELGAGSGLLALWAARQGAVATATDINPVAVAYLHKNSQSNQLPLHIYQSDLFTAIPLQTFDMIAINPPYYRRQPKTYSDYAWYCGENGEYFDRLFAGIGKYLHPQSQVMMVLSDGCDLALIRELAQKNGCGLKKMLEKKNLIEENYIFKIEPILHQ